MIFTLPPIRTTLFYLTRNFGGIVADIFLSSGLVYLAGFPLFLAGLCGVIFHALVNYLIDLKITFRDKFFLPGFWTGLTRYLKSFFGSMIVRMVILTLLGWFTNFPAILSLLVALGLASGLHAVLTRYYVFRSKP